MLESVHKSLAAGRPASALGNWSGAAGEGIAIRERQGLAVVELAAFSRTEAVRQSLAETLGVALPGPGLSSETAGIAALCIGPTRWLLIAGDAAAPGLPTPSEEQAAMVDLTHGRVILSFTGANAARTLMKGTAIDRASSLFPDGAVAATALARTAVVIWRRGDAFDVIVSRSYAQSLLDWLIGSGSLA